MSKVVEVIVQAVDKASKTFDDVSKSSKKLESALKSVKKYSWIAMTALAWVGTLAVKQAVELEPVKNAFENLSKTVWQSSDQMLKSLKQASKGAVSEYDLMLSANRAMKLGVAENTEDMTDLMKIARLYGQQMGQDVTQSFNDIVTWLWRWSPMILDNLWIIIDSEKAYEEYAQKIWKASNELTKQEKTHSLVNATLVEWRKALDEFGEPAQTMGERLQALKNQFMEMATRVGEALIPVLENVMKKLEPIIQKVSDWIAENPEFASKILMIWTAIAWVTFALSSILPTLTSVITLLWTKWTWFVGALWLVWGGLKLLEDKIVSTDEQLQIYYDQVVDLNDAYEAGLISEDEYRAKMQELETQIQATKDKSQTFGQYLKNELDNTLKIMTFDTKERKKAFEAFGTVVNAVGGFFDKVAEKIWNFILKVQDALKAIRDFIRESRESWIGSWIVETWKTIAKNIVKFRDENGEIKQRKDLLKVPKLGPTAYKQCAGFIRIFNGKNPLEVTAVHPESYDVAEKLLTKLGYSVDSLIKKDTLESLKVELSKVDVVKMSDELGIGGLTLKDIIDELSKPGRDPREDLPKPILRSDVLKFEDLKDVKEAVKALL